ncbi:MAG TPA: sulfate adenylyltransferase [Candidatus Limnocylindrales bacterium]|nr:sulfate adenylyltransferase [Candidatus Limnocylindrales bacterium]
MKTLEKEMVHSILPHGGRLINRVLEGEQRQNALDRIERMERIYLSNREISDLEMIAVGAFSPLEGFMGREDYESVVYRMRLANGLPWTIPITLSVSKEKADTLKIGEEIALYSQTEVPVGILHLQEKYTYDKEIEAKHVFLTTELKHPGVAYLYEMKEILLGGRITLLNRINYDYYDKYRLDPKETRYLFRYKGWHRVVAFQTRNPIHRAHEYIQKCALETVDGLLIHPLVGETKGDDIPAEIRMKCYLALIENYYPKDRVLLAVFPAAMRYAGPREAIFHALVRKNYGCTHFIVGRDHAGVGNYYGTYDAQKIFSRFGKDEIGITPVFFDHTFYCRRCGHMASEKTCVHSDEHRVILSGTKVREMLRAGEMLPDEFTRREVSKILIEAYRETK